MEKTPVCECEWVLSFASDYGYGEASVETEFVKDRAQLLYLFADALIEPLRTARSITVVRNPAYVGPAVQKGGH